MDKLECLLEMARQERDKFDSIVKWLENAIPQLSQLTDESESAETPPVVTTKSTTRRRRIPHRKGPSVPTLAKVILRSFPQGLTVPQLLADLRKVGYVSTSKNPANVLNSILRQEPDAFKRSSEGRWTLMETESAKTEDSNGTKETPIH
jgi:hypothetical protein